MILYQTALSRNIYDKMKVKPHKKVRQNMENCPKIEPQDG